VIQIANFGLVRIDDRLIHGQVIAVWCNHQRFDRIIIVDDTVAADSFMQEVLRLAAPPGIDVAALSVADAAEALSGAGSDPETMMLLFKNPRTVAQLFEAGVRFTALNVGGMGSGPGRRNVFKNISMSDQDLSILKDLQSKGVQITLLTVPGEKSKPFAELVR
jgi:PTS system mannose-specific IIB component